MLQLTPVPAGRGSLTVTPVAVPVPVALLLLTATVYPMAEPAPADAVSAMLLILRLGAQVLIARIFLAAFGSALNRGIGRVLEAAAPSLAVKAGGAGA